MFVSLTANPYTKKDDDIAPLLTEVQFKPLFADIYTPLVVPAKASVPLTANERISPLLTIAQLAPLSFDENKPRHSWR